MSINNTFIAKTKHSATMMAQGSSQTCYQKITVNLPGLLSLKTYLISFRRVLGTWLWTDTETFSQILNLLWYFSALYKCRPNNKPNPDCNMNFSLRCAGHMNLLPAFCGTAIGKLQWVYCVEFQKAETHCWTWPGTQATMWLDSCQPPLSSTTVMWITHAHSLIQDKQVCLSNLKCFFSIWHLQSLFPI